MRTARLTGIFKFIMRQFRRERRAAIQLGRFNYCLAALLAMAVCCSSQAEPNQADEQLLVFGQRVPDPLSLSAAAGTEYSVTREQFELANAASLDAVLESIPGLNVRVGGDGTPRIDMRGLRTRQVKVLINGVPLNAVGDGSFDPSLIPTDYIEAVNVIPGAGSQLYGDGALAGAINIATRRGQGTPAGDLRFELGEYGAERFTGTFSAGFENGDVFISLGRRHHNAWGLSADFNAADTEDGGKRLNSDLTRNNLYAIVNWRPLTAWEFSATLNYYAGERGIPTSIFNDRSDIFASRPRYERANREDGWYAQVSALFEPQSGLRNHAWAYITNDVTVSDRFEDSTFTPTTDPSIRNTYNDETRSRVIGFQDILSYETESFGTVAASFAYRQEQLSSDCLIKDLPIVDESFAAPVTTSASGYILEFTQTSTNNHGATTAAGGNDAVARLTATNRSGGGIDFRLENLGMSNFGPESYLKYIYLSPGPAFDLASLSWSQAVGSEGDIGNINIQANEIDGYNYALRVNFRRPEVGDALLDGDTALWLFDQGDVNDFFTLPAFESMPLPDSFAAVTARRTLANGFWGPAEIQATGGTPGDVFNVNVQALNAAPQGLPPSQTALEIDPQIGDLLVDVRLCSGAGGGGGAGAGGGRVERIPSLRFARRLITQDRDIDVFNGALEYAFHPLPQLGIVASLGYHASIRDDGSNQAAPAYSVAAYYDLSSQLRLRATAAHKVRLPSVNQLYDPDRGNPELNFERANSIEFGFDYEPHELFMVTATAFKQDIDDFIQTDLITERFENIAELSIDGFELAVQQREWHGLRWRSGYSYLSSRDENSDGTRKQQQYTPTHRLTVTFDYRFWKSANFHLDIEYTADQFYYARTFPTVRDELNDFTVVDTSISLPIARTGAAFYVGADNLFDVDYEESYGIPQMGRFVYAGFKLSLP